MSEPLVRVVSNEIRTHNGTDRIVQVCDCGHVLPANTGVGGALSKRRWCRLCAIGHPPGEQRSRNRLLPAPKNVEELLPLLGKMRGTVVRFIGDAEPVAPSRVTASGRGRGACVLVIYEGLTINVTAYADLGITGIADARRWAQGIAEALGIEYREPSAPRRRFRPRLVGEG